MVDIIVPVVIFAGVIFLLGRFLGGLGWQPQSRSRAVGMWKSRVRCEISKGRGKVWESCLCFSTLSTARHFHSPPQCSSSVRIVPTVAILMYRNPDGTEKEPGRATGRVPPWVTCFRSHKLCFLNVT